MKMIVAFFFFSIGGQIFAATPTPSPSPSCTPWFVQVSTVPSRGFPHPAFDYEKVSTLGAMLNFFYSADQKTCTVMVCNSTAAARDALLAVTTPIESKTGEDAKASSAIGGVDYLTKVQTKAVRVGDTAAAEKATAMLAKINGTKIVGKEAKP